MTVSRRPALLLALLLCVLMLFASLFPALAADHDCPGEDCAICALIALCEDFLRQLTPCLAVTVTAFLVCAGRLFPFAAPAHPSATPITHKIKLLD